MVMIKYGNASEIKVLHRAPPLHLHQASAKTLSKIKYLSAFAWGRTHAMQALTNVATAPSTAASDVFTNCATEKGLFK